MDTDTAARLDAIDAKIAGLQQQIDEVWTRLIFERIRDVNDQLVLLRGMLRDVPAEPGVPLDEPVVSKHP